jgi:hypothetical protein
MAKHIICIERGIERICHGIPEIDSRPEGQHLSAGRNKERGRPPGLKTSQAFVHAFLLPLSCMTRGLDDILGGVQPACPGPLEPTQRLDMAGTREYKVNPVPPRLYRRLLRLPALLTSFSTFLSISYSIHQYTLIQNPPSRQEYSHC